MPVLLALLKLLTGLCAPLDALQVIKNGKGPTESGLSKRQRSKDIRADEGKVKKRQTAANKSRFLRGII